MEAQEIILFKKGYIAPSATAKFIDQASQVGVSYLKQAPSWITKENYLKNLIYLVISYFFLKGFSLRQIALIVIYSVILYYLKKRFRGVLSKVK